ATSRFQLILTPTPRAMRGVPGLHVPGGFQAGAVVMPNDGRSFTALGPVTVGGVATGRRERSHRVRAGQDVVHIYAVPAAADHFALLGQRRLIGDVDVLSVKIFHALAHHHALGFGPRAFTNAITRFDARVTALHRRS